MGNYVWKAKGKPADLYLASDSDNFEQSDEEEYESCFDSESILSSEQHSAPVVKYEGTHNFEAEPTVHHIRPFQYQEVILTEEKLSEKVTIDEFLTSEFDEYTQSDDMSEIEDDNLPPTHKNTQDGSHHVVTATTKKPCLTDQGPGGDATHKLMSVNEFIKSENAIEQATQGTSSMAWNISFNSQSPGMNEPSPALKERLQTKKPLSTKRKEFQRSTRKSISVDYAKERKVLDLRRWHCISRPQYKKSCGISSVVSVWNYLFSNLGTGSLDAITQETALGILGFKEPFDIIRFGPFTGNATLMRWFRKLNDFFGVSGKAFYLYKPKGRVQTKLMTDIMALEHLKSGLCSNEMAFIYHCYNHYFCPIGFESTPQNPLEAYASKQCIENNQASQKCADDLPTTPVFNEWIFIGEPSKNHPPIHCKRWDDILQDLHMEGPEYYNIRHPEKGIQHRRTKKKGGNLHCIIAFKKVAFREQAKRQKKV
uniref:Basic immunoglobulin-like variable motif-containing protein n=1 Tax=Phallusia mammillata TaxID=59560 RepID=A0A6F9D736_9ASCI|nr:basic immunoglobulin-like variable motif-containing protein [Phallusia mammillata]